MRRVWVVEDERFDRETLEDRFGSSSYDLKVFASYRDLFGYLNKHSGALCQKDMLFLDCHTDDGRLDQLLEQDSRWVQYAHRLSRAKIIIYTKLSAVSTEMGLLKRLGYRNVSHLDKNIDEFGAVILRLSA